MSVNANCPTYYSNMNYMYVYYYCNVYAARTLFYLNNCSTNYIYGFQTYQGGLYLENCQYIVADNHIQYSSYYMQINNGGLWMSNSTWRIIKDQDVQLYSYKYTYCAYIQQGDTYVGNCTIDWDFQSKGPYAAPPSTVPVYFYGFYSYSYSTNVYYTMEYTNFTVTSCNQSSGGWLFYPNYYVYPTVTHCHLNYTHSANGGSIFLCYANSDRRQFEIDNTTVEYQTHTSQPMRGGIMFNAMQYVDLVVNDSSFSMRNDGGFYPFNMFYNLYSTKTTFRNCTLDYNIGGGNGQWGPCDASPGYALSSMDTLKFIDSTYTVTTRDEPVLLHTFNFTSGAANGLYFDNSKMIWNINSPNSVGSFLYFYPGSNPSLGVLDCKDSALTMSISGKDSPATMISVVPGSGLSSLVISNTILTLTQTAPLTTPSTIIYMESQKGAVFNDLVMNLNGPTLTQDPSQSTVIMGVELVKSIGTINNFTINGNGQGKIYGVGCDIVSMPTFNGCTVNNCYAGLYANFFSMPTLLDSSFDNCVNGVLLQNASNATLGTTTINGSKMGATLSDGSWISLIECNITNSTTSISLSESTAWSLSSNFNKASVLFNDPNSTLIINWKLQLHVMWQNGAIIPGAAVSVIDNLGRLQVSATADENGIVPWFLVTEYIQTNYVVKTFFSPYTVSASIGGLTGTASVTTDITKEANVTITDPFPPVVTITSPDDNTFQNYTTVTLAGTATDVGSGISALSFTYDGVNWQTVPATRVWVYSMEVPENLNPWLIQVKLTDIAGMESVASLNLTIDLTPPMIDVLSPADNSLGNKIGVDLQGFVEIGSAFTVNHRPVALGTDGAFTYGLRLVEGKNVFSLFARDRAGNTNSTTWTLLLDITPPALSVSSPVDGFLTNQNTVQVTGKTEPGANVTVDGAGVTVQPDGSFTFTYTLKSGPNPITIVASDAAGNKAIILRTVLMDNEIHLSVAYPEDNMATNQITLLVRGTTDTDVLLRLNEGLVTVGSDGSFSVTYTLSEGMNELKFAGLDRAGNSISITRHVILDTLRPDLEIFSPSPNALLRTHEVSVNGSCEPGINLTVNGEPVDTSSGTFSKTLTLPEGASIINVNGADKAGNTVSFQIPVLVDLTPPSLEIVEPLDGFRTRDLTVVVVGITEPGTTVTINDVPVVVDAFGKFSTSVTLQKGSNTIKVTSTDAAGNSASKSINVKNTAPPAAAAENSWWWTAIGLLLALGIMVPLTILLVNLTLKSRSKKEGEQ
jgi:hypothetical protein